MQVQYLPVIRDEYCIYYLFRNMDSVSFKTSGSLYFMHNLHGAACSVPLSVLEI